MSKPEDEPRKTLTDRTQIYPGHREIIKEGPREGQQKDYVVLAQEEIDKGFTRPYRDAYKHLTCGAVTTMGRTLSETYARDPHFYSGTFCAGCRSHFPVGADGEFVWTLGRREGGNMTTKHSPIAALKAQADRIAATLKAAERGDGIDVRFAEKIREARARGAFKVGIVMDDKVITLELTWATVRETSEAGLSEYIVRQMQEAPDAPH